jgi:hypothetical protein
MRKESSQTKLEVYLVVTNCFNHSATSFTPDLLMIWDPTWILLGYAILLDKWWLLNQSIKCICQRAQTRVISFCLYFLTNPLSCCRWLIIMVGTSLLVLASSTACVSPYHMWQERQNFRKCKAFKITFLNNSVCALAGFCYQLYIELWCKGL